jgi:uncharacterized protein
MNLVGRMAFGNYILHMLICTTRCYGYRFGLFGRVARTGQIEIVVLIWILLLLTSPAWLANFQYGSLEWLDARSPTASASPSFASPEGC